MDYFLWALQRLYNAQEERFIRAVWEKVSVVEDADDTRQHPYGEYYTKQTNPIGVKMIERKA